MSWSGLWQLIIILPQIIGLVRQVLGLIEKAKAEKVERDRQEALDKLQKAKTEGEVKNAAEDFLNTLR
jgi:hypothetical protein